MEPGTLPIAARVLASLVTGGVVLLLAGTVKLIWFNRWKTDAEVPSPIGQVEPRIWPRTVPLPEDRI